MRHIAAAILFASALVLAAGCSGPGEQTKKDDSLQYEYEGDTVRATPKEMSVEATYLSPDGLDIYYSAFRDGKYKNPFSPKSYLIFSLTVENKTKNKMTYNPKMTFLQTTSSRPVTAKDLSGVYMDFEFAQLDDIEERADAFKASCYDTSCTIMPGESVQKLIVFPREDIKNSATLLVESLYSGYESRPIALKFKRGLALK